MIVLRSILDAAQLDGRIGRNAAQGVKLPPERSRPMRFLTADQLAAVAAAIRPTHYRPLVLTAGWVGLRWGELAGLALDHVDLLRHTITIDRQLTEVNGRLAYGPPKTSAGVRTVTIPEDLTDLLAEHFATGPVQASGLAFPTVTGRPMRRNNFRTIWRNAADGCFLFPSQDRALAEALNGSLRESLVARARHDSGTVTRLRRSEA